MADQEQIDTFIVTARKWRPLLFADVVGQDHISTTLSNALSTNRVHHAYLFCGPRGVGKTTTARIFARALNCSNSKNGMEPCNECDSCRDILSSRSLDVIEIDGASNNSVDDIRKLRENAKYPPVHGKYKMYIIDEVHMLSTSAFNALLKTLEEPPPHLLFMFATTESHKVPATIVSRCQRFDFRRMQVDDIVRHIAYIANAEKVSIDEQSLVAIAKKGDGSMRDAQSIFDQVRAFCGDTIGYKDVSSSLHLIDEEFFFRISDAVHERNTAAMFGLVQEVMTRGYDIHECLSGLLEHFRNILTILATEDTTLIEASSITIARYKEVAAHFRRAEVLRIMTMINTTEQQLKFSAQPRFRFELLLSQMASMDSTVEIGHLIQELRESKKNGTKIGMLNAVVHATTPVAPAAKTVAQPQPPTQGKAAPANPVRQVRQVGPEEGQVRNINESMIQKREVAVVAEVPGTVSNGQRHTIVQAAILQSGWEDFVKLLPQSQAAVKLSVNSDDICSIRFFDSEILILNSEKFMCDDLHSRRTALSKHLEKHFGGPVKVTVVHSQNIHELPDQKLNGNTVAQHVEALTIENIEKNSLAENSMQNQIEKLPLENLLIELFGAKKIPISSLN